MSNKSGDIHRNIKDSNNINKENVHSLFDLIVKLFNIIWDISYVILPSVGYIHQYMKIVSLKRTEGFSKLISFILIMSYIFRIFFWIGQHFEKSILLNAIFGILIQLLLLRVCLKYDTRLQNNDSIYRFFNLKEFWNWPFFTDYLIFITIFSFFITIISLIIGFDNKPYVFFLGVITSVIEAFSDIPQIYEIYISKNPYTVSYLLIFWWLSGDIFKVSYFFCRDTPIQLIVCGIFQLTTDIILSSQIVYYRYFCTIGKVNNINNFEKEENKGDEINNSEKYQSIKKKLLLNTINFDNDENQKDSNDK